jgi:hypothetical protein
MVYGDGREIELPVTGYPIPEPWSSRFVKYSDPRRTLCGGAFGRRFLSNGHWQCVVDEDTFQAASAAGWKNVGGAETWYEPTSLPYPPVSIRKIQRRAFGVTFEVPTLATRPLQANRVGYAVGRVVLTDIYVDLLREIGVHEVAVIAGDSPFVRKVVSPGVAVVLGNRMPEDY